MSRAKRDVLTEFFKKVVGDLNDVLGPADVDDDVVWDLSRRLHATWRQAVAASEHEAAPEKGRQPRSHAALSELLRLVELEVGE